MRDEIAGGRRQGLAAAALVGIALALYLPATSAWFFQDDLQWLAGTLTFEPRSLLDLNAHQHFYRPVISMYFWAATPLFGGSPVLFHWANNLLHAANGLLVLLLAGRLGLKPFFSFFAAVIFVSIPAHIEATAWVSALAEPVTTFFGIISVYAWLRVAPAASGAWKVLSVAAFCLALMTHESAVVLLPLLMLADWAFVQTPESTGWRGWPGRAACFTPHIAALGIYLLADLWVNSRSYLVEEGHYRLGLHAIPNTFAYVVTLYAGEQNLQSFIMVGVVLAALLVKGTPRVIFATAWLLLSILPFSFFTWSNTSRYAYMPAVGMGLLMAEGLAWIEARMRGRLPDTVRLGLTGVLALFLSVRFMLFAAENISHFREGTERYRQFAVAIREQHEAPPAAGVVWVDARTVEALHFRYLEALVQWEFKDPTLKLSVRP